MENIQAKDIKIVKVSDLVPNPKNHNRHGEPQIDRLIKLLEYQGFRNPIVVSNRSGMIVAGHGRHMAAVKMGLEYVPVIYQDFDDETQEIAYQVSDNAIAAWAELDLSGINSDIIDMGPEFNLDMLGLKDFKLDPSELPQEPEVENITEKIITCPHCDKSFIL